MVKLIITGDVNLMNVTDGDVPFRRVKETLLSADLVFANLECCLSSRLNEGSAHVEGFFADPQIGGEALDLLISLIEDETPEIPRRTVPFAVIPRGSTQAA